MAKEKSTITLDLVPVLAALNKSTYYECDGINLKFHNFIYFVPSEREMPLDVKLFFTDTLLERVE